MITGKGMAQVLVSLCVLAAFALGTHLVLSRSLPTENREAALLVVGALINMAGQVVQYWIGSSQGSLIKTQAMLQHQGDGRPNQ